MTYNHALIQAIDANNINDFWNILYADEAFVQKDIEYNPDWNNGTGYFNGAVNAELPELEIGEVGRCKAPAPNNRRILIVKTQFGNVVVFERYTPKEDGALNGPLAINMPDLVRESEMIGTEGALTMEQLVNIFGNGLTPTYNVGVRLHQFMEHVKTAGRQTRSLRFRRFEAQLVMARNLPEIVNIIRLSGSEESAVESLTDARWPIGPDIKDAHEHNSIPFRSDGYGLDGKGRYRLTESQAKVILGTPLSDLLSGPLDVIAREYHRLAKELTPASHQLAEDIEGK